MSSSPIFITPIEQPVAVINNNNYNCSNVKGHQVCFRAIIYTDLKGRDWMNDSDNPLHRHLPEHFPICLFYGKKEGEKMYLKLNKEITIGVTLKGANKNFEEMLFERTAGFGGVYSPYASEPDDLSEIQQYCFIVTAHQQYADSIGRKSEAPETFRYSSGWIKCLQNESKKAPKLSFMEKITTALPDDDNLSPVEKLGTAILKVSMNTCDHSRKLTTTLRCLSIQASDGYRRYCCHSCTAIFKITSHDFKEETICQEDPGWTTPRAAPLIDLTSAHADLKERIEWLKSSIKQ